jgi:RNA polymerase sigma-70 factor (ECF subfamily)
MHVEGEIEMTAAGGRGSLEARMWRGGNIMEQSGDLAPEPFSRAARDRLVRLAFRFVWNRDDAEDVVQESLAAAHGHRETLREPDRWWSWLRRIVIHRCHTAGRRKRTRARHGLRLAASNTAETDAAGEGLGAAELKELVWRALPGLPERQKEVVVLRHLEGMSYEQIGELLEIAPATARVHAKAGLESLRSMLAMEKIKGLHEVKP